MMTKIQTTMGFGKNTSPAISLENIEVCYGFGSRKTKVLHNININIATGSIYGLLGPSGCGKTTLLKCVTALLKPDSGRVSVFNETPGSAESNIPGWKLGYMPQELALYSELTSEETLAYFGRLQHMEPYRIRTRIEFLLKFLNLVNPKIWVQYLSGGEKRRLSLAIALLHKPPLLILDEPTVGVDPILRKNIWNYLVKMSTKDNVTVIITTHYVEEARLADKVAFMRKGRILAQDEPELLLQTYKSKSLEDVFVRVCQEQKDQKEPNISINSLPFDSEIKLSYSMKDFFQLPSTRRIIALVILNFLTMWRNRVVCLFQFLSPTLQMLLFFWAWSNPKDLHVAVFNQDNILGPQYLHCINNETIHQITVNSLNEGINMVQDGEAWAVINIWPNFTTANIRRYLSHDNVPKKVIDASAIHVRHDNTDQVVYYSLQEALINAYFCFVQQSSNNSQHLPIPVKFGRPIYGPPKSKYRDYFAPGILTACIFSMPLALSAMAFVTSKVSGLLERTYISGTTSFELISGYLITQVGVIILQSILVLSIAMGIFEVQNNGSLFLLLCLTTMIGVSGMTFGFFLSTIANDGVSAMMLGLGSFMPLFYTSGTLWPIEGMPKYINFITKLQPMTLPRIAISWIMSHGQNLSFYDVRLGFAVSLAWIIIFLILSLIVMRIRK